MGHFAPPPVFLGWQKAQSKQGLPYSTWAKICAILVKQKISDALSRNVKVVYVNYANLF